jgi:translation elongation factor EF-Tu-like GTPase
MTLPPTDSAPQLWMTAVDVFHIRGRGTVVTGQLEGQGWLTVGDTLVCDGDRWQVSGIELFGGIQTAAGPGANVGVLLRGGPHADVLRGKAVQFVPSPGRIKAPAAGGPGRRFGRRRG